MALKPKNVIDRVIAVNKLHVHLVHGVKKSINVFIYSLMDNMSVESSMKSSIVHKKSGKLLPPSVQDVAVPSTAIDKPSYEECEKQLQVLMAMFQGLLQNTLSKDVIHLAMYHAKDCCQNLPKEDFDNIANRLLEIAMKERKRNPLHRMFD